MMAFGKKLGVAMICGSLLFSTTAANAAATTSVAAQTVSPWVALSSLGTASSAAAVSAAQENPQGADPYADHSGHGLGASVGLLALGILLVILFIAFAHDKDDDDDAIAEPRLIRIRPRARIDLDPKRIAERRPRMRGRLLRIRGQRLSMHSSEAWGAT